MSNCLWAVFFVCIILLIFGCRVGHWFQCYQGECEYCEMHMLVLLCFLLHVWCSNATAYPLMCLHNHKWKPLLTCMWHCRKKHPEHPCLFSGIAMITCHHIYKPKLYRRCCRYARLTSYILGHSQGSALSITLSSYMCVLLRLKYNCKLLVEWCRP